MIESNKFAIVLQIIVFSFLNSIIQTMREQYQGAVPLFTLENIRDFQSKLKQKMKVYEKEEHLNFQKDNINCWPSKNINEFMESCPTLDETKCHSFFEMKKMV